ncbi:MAG: PHP domain-containing protein [Pikeienuella sp.]
MRPLAFAAPGKFWRGNLHTHSDQSDGVIPPAEVCRRYRAEGYDFISLTDHFVGLYNYPITDTSPYRTDDFTTILGAELHTGAMENGEIWHVLAVGLPPDFAPTNAPHFGVVEGQETGPEVAQRARDAGAFVTIAHPEWSGMTEADAASITAAHAVEVYNHSCAVDADRPHGFATLDLLLSKGVRLNAIATDDAHFASPDHFGGWVMVKAEENTPEALLAALKAGAFYASQGPEIRDIEIKGREITIESSAATTVVVMGHGSTAKAVHGTSMTRTTLKLAAFRDSGWIRVSIRDAGGKRAWSNPIWLDD